MAEREGKKTLGRREFIMAAGGGAVGVAAVAAKPAKAASPQKEAAGDGGYRKTDHIKKYYELTRF